MEMVAAPLATTTGGTPFRDHDVREWSRIDSITGALERARLETDNWSAKTADACHRYGKVVDSRAHTGADGSIQAKASRQLEVFQSRAAGARVQVVKTTTVSSSRWSGKTAGTPPVIPGIGFEDLQLPLNPLDISSQKAKASVGRGVNRRPPTRHPRNSASSAFSNDLHSHIRNAHFTAAANLHRVSRLCHQIHESAVRNAFGRKNSESSIKSTDDSANGVEITEITSNNSDLGSHSNLSRTKSSSSENIQQVPESNSSVKITEITDDTEQLQTWKRDSKVRRSLHIPKSSSPTNETTLDDLPENRVNVKKLRDELEKGRRLTQALRNNSISSDLNALDNIIQSISSASSLEKCSTDDNLDDASEKEQSGNRKKKRESFVSVECLQEVKSRLRRTSSPSSDIHNTNDNESTKDENYSDDGIVTEDNKVKSYVFGMEKMLQAKKPVLGTGSLESRSKFTNGNIIKNEDWFNRRKSYGFEKVHNAEETPSISLRNKNVVESSTDSGICRSSEIMVVPTATKSNHFNGSNGRFNSESESDVENKTNSVNHNAPNGIHYGNVKKMTSIFSQEDKKKDNQFSNRSRNKQNLQTTITIPIVKNNNVVDLSWNSETEKADEITGNGVQENKFRKTSVVSNDQLLDDEGSNNNRRAKKVGFCKTEVHFAAESGKVNIVETDEKPPPTQNFRRRRRNSSVLRDPNEDFNKNGLPILHFGDSGFEKTMFGVSHDDDLDERSAHNTAKNRSIDNKTQIMSAFSIVTVNNNDSNNHIDCSEDEKMHNENDHLKGILKNKPIKPKPYHLGETIPLHKEISDDDSKWGVRLRSVEKESINDTPIWKSTVTVHNTVHRPQNSLQPEFQKLLRNLRPTRKPDYLSDNESNRYSDSFANIRIVPTSKDNRRSSWSVADQLPISDELVENRGYSTKVNFGDGEATVIQNDQSTWPRSEIPEKDSKPILNKGLVVRIGRQDSASKHTVCSKTTTRNNNNTTTTTKITIDLSPSPPTNDKQSPFTYTKYNRSQQLQHSFKSTPLVLNTIKDHGETVSRIPEQLEALRKLYEDIPSEDADSDADKEVQQLLSRAAERELNMLESDTSSVVSGSWSKMKAFKNLSDVGKNSFRDTRSKFDHNRDKDMRDYSQRSEPKDSHKLNHTLNKYSIPSNTSKFSPVVLRKSIPIIQTDQKELNVEVENIKSTLDRKTDSSIHQKQSPIKEFRNDPDQKVQANFNSDKVVLRQPKKSEMTYFGVDVDSKNRDIVPVIRKEQKQLQKPDLLQHHKRTPSPTKKIMKPRRPTPEKEVLAASENEHIYENLRPLNKETRKSKYSNAKDFDSSILDELTKAADQILQAVNGYTSEDCQNRLSSDDEVKKPLDTISETKSWRNSTDMEVKNQQRMRPTLASAAKMKVKRTSSTSSIESLSKERRKTISTERRTATGSASSSKPSLEISKKKASSSDTASSTKASTKARRLQRASSREALLQSHGSSSEDLPAKLEAPSRKPRLIKKTKAHQLTISSGFDLKKPPERRSRTEKAENSRNDSRIMGSLPEIRHRTAVSTITNTAEKSSRDRSRTRIDDKSRCHAKKETSSRGTVSSSSTKYTSTSRGHQSQPSQRGSTTSGAAVGVTQHRISTANIKRCHRSDNLRH